MNTNIAAVHDRDSFTQTPERTTFGKLTTTNVSALVLLPHNWSEWDVRDNYFWEFANDRPIILVDTYFWYNSAMLYPKTARNMMCMTTNSSELITTNRNRFITQLHSVVGEIYGCCTTLKLAKWHVFEDKNAHRTQYP